MDEREKVWADEAAPRVNNLIVVSDLHVGCRCGLCPAEAVHLDGGGTYSPSVEQRLVWQCWREFWDTWVPEVTHHEPFAVLVNGDALDGVHHGSKTQISQNHADQIGLAYRVLAPIVELCEGRFYMTRGTEAHVGQSAENEELLAQQLNARQVKGHYSSQRFRFRLGNGIVDCLHHIGTTGSSAYETTAVYKELMEALVEAARWGDVAPDVVVRSHRHRHVECRSPTRNTYGIAFVTAGWQLKTPFAYRIPGGRMSDPQIGGSLIRQGDQDLYTRHRTWAIACDPVLDL
jgi:hypothetical protein